jgi:transposase-like protein
MLSTYCLSPAVERAMKIQEVILRAIAGRLKWYQAARILGISDRQMRRWKRRYEKQGYDGLSREGDVHAERALQPNKEDYRSPLPRAVRVDVPGLFPAFLPPASRDLA